MQTNVANDACQRRTRHHWPWCKGLPCAILLWLVAGSACAASVYRCTGDHGKLAFQDTPCTGAAQQRKLELHPQPLIGAPGEAAARARGSATRTRHAEPRSRSSRRRRADVKPAMSWECHAADGEVFYRHTRCPGSVAGDGTVRRRHAGKTSGRRTRSEPNAWGKVSVHGKKITRAEACHRIHSAGAAVRDGHQRDDRVSTYDHLMGRDPCNGV